MHALFAEALPWLKPRDLDFDLMFPMSLMLSETTDCFAILISSGDYRTLNILKKISATILLDNINETSPAIQ